MRGVLRAALAALLLAAACGTGTDGKPVAPPTAPAPAPEPRVCTDEWERALGRHTRPVLVDEWDGTPFPIYFDEAIPASERADAEHFFGVAERLADRIEDQIGYRIIELGGWLVEKRTFNIRDADLHDCERVRPGEIIVTVIPEDRPDLRAAARSSCAAFFWDDNDLDATWDRVFSHELFHLFGFGHSLVTHPQEAWQGGVPMSVRLTNSPLGPRDLGVTFDDVDALRCIFPKGG